VPESNPPPRILVTGVSGKVGRIVPPMLRRLGWSVVGFDQELDYGHCDRYVRGDITDAAALAEAVEGCHTVLHLAANPDTYADFLTALVEPNMVGTWRLLEAAQAAGVERVVLASSINAGMGPEPAALERSPPELVDPANPYGLTKVFAEEAGRYVHRRHALRVLCARFGAVCTHRRLAQTKQAKGETDDYLPPTDLERFLEAALRWDGGFAQVFAVSRSHGEPPYDLDAPARGVAFHPQDRWPEGLPAEWLTPDPDFEAQWERWRRHRSERRRVLPLEPGPAFAGDPRRILVTGAAGAVGRALCPALRDAGWTVVGLDRSDDPGGCNVYHRADITDRAAVDSAVRDCAAVVHLAANPDSNAAFDDLVDPNIRGLWTVFDATRAAGCPRMVVASSINACCGPFARRAPRPIGADLIDANNPYGVTKVLAEQMGWLFHRHCGMAVAAVRIGWFPRDEGEVRRMIGRGGTPTYCSWDDLVRCIEAALGKEDLGYARVFAASADADFVDHTQSAERIGFVPRDRWPEGMPPHLRDLARELAAS